MSGLSDFSVSRFSRRSSVSFLLAVPNCSALIFPLASFVCSFSIPLAAADAASSPPLPNFAASIVSPPSSPRAFVIDASRVDVSVPNARSARSWPATDAYAAFASAIDAFTCSALMPAASPRASRSRVIPVFDVLAASFASSFALAVAALNGFCHAGPAEEKKLDMLPPNAYRTARPAITNSTAAMTAPIGPSAISHAACMTIALARN